MREIAIATWAYKCFRCGDPDTSWYVDADAVTDFPRDANIVLVKVGDQWLCAELDRSLRFSVEGLLLHQAIPTDAASCEDCEDRDA